jgi:hypothetical protein
MIGLNRRGAAVIRSQRMANRETGGRRLSVISESGGRTFGTPATRYRQFRPSIAWRRPVFGRPGGPGPAWRSAASRRRNLRVTLTFWAFNVLLLAGDLLDHAWVARHGL